MKKACLPAVLALALTACQTEADLRPANYDELALAPGHWEWVGWRRGTSGAWGTQTPAGSNFTQQLTFGAGGQLTVRRNGALRRQISYQFSVESFERCGERLTQVPLVSFASEPDLPDDFAKTYDLRQQDGHLMLMLVGKTTCVDSGAIETYRWVAE